MPPHTTHPHPPQPSRHHRFHQREHTPRQALPTTTFTSPSPAPKPRPASCTGPTGPTLRANPFPEVTDLICRLPLPTLIYRPEASYLGDLLRIWVRTCPKIGTSRLWESASPMQVAAHAFFTDRRRHAGRRKNRGALRQTVLPTPFLSASGFQGHGALNRKENSFPDLRRWTQACSRYRGPAFPSRKAAGSSGSRLRNKYRIPFRRELPAGTMTPRSVGLPTSRGAAHPDQCASQSTPCYDRSRM